MPTYQYTCTECGEGLEVVQKFTDDALTVCPNCGGALRKVFSSVGIVFKGSGFYRTDSRSSSNGSVSADSAGKSESSAKSETSSSGKSESGKSESSSSSGKSDSSSSGTSTAAA